MNFLNKLHFPIKVNHLIIQKITEIEKFKGKWESLALSDKSYLQELRQLATIQSVGSSTRIEGSLLNDEEIKSLINNLEINHLQNDKQKKK